MQRFKKNTKLKIFSVRWLELLSVIILCLAIGSCNGSDGAGSKNYELIELSSDGILTMSPSGSHPITQYKGRFDRTYFGYYTSGYQVVMQWFDNDSFISSGPEVLWEDWGCNSDRNKLGDDHANPSIIVLRYQKGDYTQHNGKLLVAAAEHGGRLEVRRGISPESIDKWEQPVSLRSTRATYSRIIEMADGTLFLFCRLSHVAPNSRATFFFWKSSDAGNNWTKGELLIDADPGTDDAIYIAVDADDDCRSFHVAANRVDYNNPSEGVWRYRDLYYLQYRSGADTWYRANGTSLGAPPFHLNELDKVYESESVTGSEDWTYISDIKGISSQPHVVSITEHGRGSADALSEPRPVVIHYHTFQDKSWHTEKVGESSLGEIVGFHYPTMATITSLHPLSILGFIHSEKAVIPVCYLRQGWEWDVDEEFPRLSDVRGVHARPFTIGFENTGLVAIWSRITDYSKPYTVWESKVIGLVIRP